MDREAKRALERAGLQLMDAGEALKEIAAIVSGVLHTRVGERRCGHCGSVMPVGQSCGCFDNGGQ